VDFRKQLDTYVAKAIELGATKATPVQTKDIAVDERVTLKCRIPKCFGYDSCIMPAHTLKADETRRIVGLYKWGSWSVWRCRLRHRSRQGDLQGARARLPDRLQVVNAVESAAFYDGHYLSVGFAAGSCKSTFCYDAECLALKAKSVD